MKLFIKNTRDISIVPKWLWSVLIASFILQCVWHSSFSSFQVRRQALSAPPNDLIIRLVSLDDSISAAKWVMLWLQAFDNQPGLSIPLKELDYDRVSQWLDLILALDNKIQYPLLAAIRFYAEVSDENKQRKMIRYVSEKFMEKPSSDGSLWRMQFILPSIELKTSNLRCNAQDFYASTRQVKMCHIGPGRWRYLF